MTNKKKNRKRQYSDPYKINNYNKLLITLDKQSLNTDMSLNNSDVTKEHPLYDPLQYLNLAIFTNNNDAKFDKELNKPIFTGKSAFDTLLHIIELNDPNIYNDVFSESTNKKKDNKSTTIGKNEIDKEYYKTYTPIQYVEIDCEINNIGDILELINKYKIEPNIEYNINMEALHKIKEPLEKLNNMIGMSSLKNNVVDQIVYFIQNLHKSSKNSGDFMHTVIYGPPGTGKTEVAKLIGKIFSKLGMLEKDKFIKVTRSDLIAGYLGQTAIKTKDVIKDALDGVLFIDEAYALGNSEKRDSFSKECIDTLCEALSDYKDRLMVIIAGYESELKDCFFNYNQGLDSRFTWRYKIDEYSFEDLYNIFLKKVKDIDWTISEQSPIKSDWFKSKISFFKFYGRDIENLLLKVKIAHSKRVFCRSKENKKQLTIVDLENGFKLYISNNEVKERQNSEYIKTQIYNSMYC